MRKLETRAEQDKKRRRNQLIIGLILVVVMLFSVLGYSFQTEEKSNTNQLKKVNYNGFSFVENSPGIWTLTIGNSNFLFKNTPTDVETIEGKINLLNTYSGKPLYIHSENREAEAEILGNINYVLLRQQYACLDLGNKTVETNATKNCDGNWPIKTCNDNFIIIELSDTKSITQVDNCVFIKAPTENITKVSDEFLFKLMGIR
jgi:hypothetical protein